MIESVKSHSKNEEFAETTTSYPYVLLFEHIGYAVQRLDLTDFALRLSNLLKLKNLKHLGTKITSNHKLPVFDQCQDYSLRRQYSISQTTTASMKKYLLKEPTHRSNVVASER